MITLALGAIAAAGLPVYTKGWAALRAGRLNINALMTVAVSGAFLIGHWPEAGMVMALYAIAEALEAQAADRARQAIARLMDLAPEEASVEEAAEVWRRLPVAEVAVGRRVRVEPGERIPLDGVVEKGSSAVNQAPITGESLPVEKEPGDPLFAGTVNGHASLLMRVTAPATGSTLARIIHAVEEAQSTRAPIQRTVDRFAARYTPVVFVLALATALLAPLLGVPALEGIYRGLVLLVIACPCALVIATPVTLVSGLAAAARGGIVIKGGLYLEQARRLRTIAFDKTGTLTRGDPRLVTFEVLADSLDSATLQRWAGSLAARSDHPISRAIAAGLEGPRVPVEDFEARGGRGVSGFVEGRRLRLASPRWLQEMGMGGNGEDAQRLAQAMAAQAERGRSVTLLADERRVLALIAIADPVRPGAVAAVADLRRLGLTPVMLSGDIAAVAEVIAADLGIRQVHSELLPDEKLDCIRTLQQQAPTAMVGDGINDAPALAGAQVGFAMGAAGSDVALEAADVVIMDDDPRRLVDTIRLSRRTMAVLGQNIALAVGIKAVFLLLTLLGSVTMWQAVFADMGTSLLVIGNGLRLLGFPQPKVRPFHPHRWPLAGENSM
jgi:Cd2+/Zn2+-exporting ATPase